MAPEPQARAEPEVPHRYEPEPHAVAAEAEPARAQSPGERHDRHPAEPAYGRPQPSEETGAQHRPDAVGDVEREPRTPAPQIYRRAPLAGDRGHQPAPAAAQQQAPQAQPQPQPQARSQQPQPQRPPLADFLIRKLSEAGAMALEDLCQFAVRDGYFAEDDNPERSVQVTLMNVAKAGFIRQLPNGTFAPATVMDTIRLRRAI